MTKTIEEAPFRLVVAIVRHGQSARLMRYAREHGTSGGTIVQAHGTAPGRLLSLLCIEDIAREVVLMAIRDDREEELLDALADRFQLRERNTGIVFSLPVPHLVGSDHQLFDSQPLAGRKSSETTPYSALFVIVDEDTGDDVADFLHEHGAPGATKIHAFGSADSSRRIFDVPVSPEKTVVLTIGVSQSLQALTKNLIRAFDLDRPGRGILFAVPVSQVRGLRQVKGGDDS